MEHDNATPPPTAHESDLALSADELQRGDLLLARIIDFGRLLWELGLDVGPGRMVDLARSLPLIAVSRREDFYTLLKVSLLSRHDQEAIFDGAFAYFWRSAAGARQRQSGADPAGEQDAQRRRALALPRHRHAPGEQETVRASLHLTGQRHPASRLNQARRHERDDDDQEEAAGTQAYSAAEALRRKDFENYTWDELQEARRLMAESRWHLGERPSRRRRPARRGSSLDLRRIFRQSLRTGGEPIQLARREVRRKPRPLVILCDISGSMSLYARLLLHFVHTVSNGLAHVETFVFGTRLTRITRQLARRDVDGAIQDVTKSVQDWSGGTRIGESLRAFNFRWGRRVLGRGAVVLIISDGWDRGDVRELGEEMARLQRSCHRLIWLNPLLGQDDYRPVTAGMRAALPYIDDFLPANNLDSLLVLGRLLERVDDRRRPARGQQRAPVVPR
ncbi:MAG: VWA domain-containing protein [Ktedonobacterales bacterium]